MHRIRNNKDLELAYEFMRYFDKCANNIPEKTKRKALIEMKREIRRYTKRGDTEEQRTFIKDYGDGYIERVKLPETVNTLEDAMQYFSDNIRMNLSPCCYDCTGRLFTGWFKVFRQKDTFIIYHRVCVDC